MTTLPGKAVSLWMDTTTAPAHRPLARGRRDAGVRRRRGDHRPDRRAAAAARRAATSSCSTRGPVGGGVTGHTTAKVTALHSLIYAELRDKFGPGGARDVRRGPAGGPRADRLARPRAGDRLRVPAPGGVHVCVRGGDHAPDLRRGGGRARGRARRRGGRRDAAALPGRRRGAAGRPGGVQRPRVRPGARAGVRRRGRRACTSTRSPSAYRARRAGRAHPRRPRGRLRATSSSRRTTRSSTAASSSRA